MKRSLKVMYADTETTGLDPKENEIFQLAFIIVVDGKVVEEHSITMRPERWDKVAPEALKVTGKTVEELKTYPDKEKAYRQFLGILGKHVDKYDRNDKFIWIGQNPDFDVGFVSAWFKEMGDKYFGSWFDRRTADLVSLSVAAKMRGILELENFKLGTVCKALDIPLDAHDALNDVRATREAFRRIASFMRAPEEALRK